jgi:hypothetical protein
MTSRLLSKQPYWPGEIPNFWPEPDERSNPGYDQHVLRYGKKNEKTEKMEKIEKN